MKRIVKKRGLVATGSMRVGYGGRYSPLLAMPSTNVRRVLVSGLLTALLIGMSLLALGGAAQARQATGVPAQEASKGDRADASRITIATGSGRNGSAGAAPGKPADDDGAVKLRPDAAVTLQHDDGTMDEVIGVGVKDEQDNVLVTSYPGIWLNRFTAASCNFPIQINQVSIMFPDPENARRDITGKAINLLVYVDADADNNPANATKLAQIPANITVADAQTFSNYPVNVSVNTPGDIYIGFSDTYNSGGQSNVSYPGAFDTTTSRGRSWVVFNNSQAANFEPDYNNLGNNTSRSTMDNAGVPGNWIVRANVVTAELCSTEFTDVPQSGAGSTFRTFVKELACRNIVSGYACGGPGEPCDSNNNKYFRPGVNVSRAQISKMVALATNLSGPTGEQMFEDVPPSSPFYDPIQQLATRGYISGYSCGGTGEPCGAGNRKYFRPGQNTSRGQLSKIVSESAQFTEDPGGQAFADVPTSGTFFVWINRLANRGVISGYVCGGAGEPCNGQNMPYFRPSDLVTRGQTTKIVASTFFPICPLPSRP